MASAKVPVSKEVPVSKQVPVSKEVPEESLFETKMSDLHDNYNDLMKHNFKIRDFFRFKYYSPRYDGIQFKAKFFERPGPTPSQAVTGAACTFDYENDFVETTNTLRTDGVIKVGMNFNLDKYVKNFSSHIDVETNYLLDEFSGKLRFMWRKSKWNLKSTLNWGEGKYLGVKGVGLLINEPTRQLGIGTGVSFALEEKAFSIYNTTLWYHVKNATLLIAHRTDRDKLLLGTLLGRVHNRIDDKTDVALGLKHNFQEHTDKVAIGVRYKQSDNFTVKAKLDSKLNLRASFEILLNQNLQLAIISRYDLGERSTPAGDVLPIGLRLNFGDLKA